MKYVVVIPYAYQPYFDECMDTIKIPQENILAVDNTVDNSGIAGSWNKGIDRVREVGAEWLIIVSAAIRFGEKGGLDLFEQLESHPDADVVHFATEGVEEHTYVRGESIGYNDGLLGWHLTAIKSDVLLAVGFFDPNFHPAYFEDIDYDLRIRKSINANWLILPVQAEGTTLGHAVALGGVKSPSEPLIAYFATKWGRHPSAPQLGEYDRPFNDDKACIGFFPPAHGRTWDE